MQIIDPESPEIVINDETAKDCSIKCNECKTNSLRKKSSLNISRNYSKENVVQNQRLFAAVFELTGLREKDGTKEFGTLILLGVMLLLFIISITGFFIMWFTEYYNDTMLAQIILKNNSESTKSWMDPNPKYDTLLKVHIFNYTNIDKYLDGIDDKIKVNDIGPLTYKEHTTKVNVSFNKNHTVTFRDRRTYQFLPEKSNCEEFDNFVLPNVPLISASTKIEKINRFKKFMAVNIINANNERAFKTLTAHEFLWGYRDRIVSMDIGTGSTHFGLLMNRNGTSVDSLQINTGEDDIRKFSTITQFNGQPLLDFWTDQKCNRVDGSDASMFPPHKLNTREDLQVFLQVLCRKIPLHFEKEVTILNNIDALRYRTPLNVFSSPEENPENACYCHNTQVCLPSGVINATKCYNGAPIFPSFPHFFSGDPKIYKDFEGIRPLKELHQTYADIHPRFAFPISGASRIQINIAVHKSSILRRKVDRLEEGTILPLIWIEITSGDFTDEIIDTLYISTFGLNAIQYALKYGTLFACIISFALIVGGFYNLTQKRRQHAIQAQRKTKRRP
ncbi:lysosome membrane protein 2 isoform X1 [Zeugodacus cucurbitae]|uniref:Scavenger receptor class B member 1 n=2 Tax=Zeugodacus cucurbitae TaxID=28588 RepID=A0A0A1WHA2_ZEUCU|nr:lysosome membrane protein 2 isoform X1 [Zeugodacus cucurbitae]